MSFLLAVEAQSVGCSILEHWILLHDSVQILVCYLLLLTVSRFVSMLTASVADKSSLVSPESKVIARSHMHFPISPIFLKRKIGKNWKFEIIWLKQAFNVLKFTIGAIWTKPKHVIFTNLHWLDLITDPVIMSKLALLLTKLAETPFKVRTELLLFSTTRILFLGMSVNTLVLDVTVTILLVKLADWNSILLISVQIFACIALPASVLEPVNANLLLYFVLIWQVAKWFDNLFKFIDLHDLSIIWCLGFFAPSYYTTLLMLIIPLFHAGQN